MPATLIVPEKKPEKQPPPAFNYLILDLDDHEPPPGYEPQEPLREAEERGVCIIGGDDGD